MPFKVTDFGSNQKLTYDFLLVINGPFVHGGGLTVLGVATLSISFFSDSVKIVKIYDFAGTPISQTLVQLLC